MLSTIQNVPEDLVDGGLTLQEEANWTLGASMLHHLPYPHSPYMYITRLFRSHNIGAWVT